jgi:hypothetical protein
MMRRQVTCEECGNRLPEAQARHLEWFQHEHGWTCRSCFNKEMWD